MPPQDTQAQEDQAKANQMTSKAALQPSPHQNTEPKGCYSDSTHRILPVHKNTPCISICRGCLDFNHQDRLFELHRSGKALRRYR